MKRLLCALIMLLLNTPIGATNENANIYTDNRQGIVVTPRQVEFTLRLKANPTTGYSWFLRDYDDNLIAPVKHTYQVPDTKLMGAPGYEVWVFRVKAAGFIVPRQTAIRMIYSRPWQTTEPGTQQLFIVSTTN